MKLIVLLSLLFMLWACAKPNENYLKKSLLKTSPLSYHELIERSDTGRLDTKSLEPHAKREEKAEEIILPPIREREVSVQALKTQEVDLQQIKVTEEKVIINADRIPLFDFLLYSFSEILKVPFIIDAELRSNKLPITLSIPEPTPGRVALGIIVEHLIQQGFSVSTKGGALYISRPKRETPSPPQSIGIGREVPQESPNVLQIVPLRYTKAGDLLPLLTEFYKGMVNIKVFAKENSLLISGPPVKINSILEFIQTIDEPYLKNKKVLLYKLNYWKPEEMIRVLTEFLIGLGVPVARAINEPGVSLIALKSLNGILAIIPEEKIEKIISDTLTKLDTAESIGQEERLYTYAPQYARASDLVEVVRRLFTGQAKPPGVTRALPVREVEGPIRAPDHRGREPVTTDTRQQSPTTERTTFGTASFSTESLNITADERRNLVLVITSPTAYKMLLEIFKELDKPSRQVLIETMIAEVTLKDEFKYGLEWYIKNRMSEGYYGFKYLGQAGRLLNATAEPLGLIFQVLTESEKFKAVINLLAQKNLINVLSTPRLLVHDNEEATINIGMDVPVITGEQTTAGVSPTGQPGVVRTFQYRSTGITLKVRPTINTEGLLTLNISQEVSQAQPNTISPIESPLILMRKINTTVTAPSGHTVVLGGLIEENKTLGERKIPFIGDLPLIGHFFKSSLEDKTKTELIILLTPRIVNTSDELVQLTEKLKNEFIKSEK